MKVFLVMLLLQSLPLPPRVAMQNPAQISQVPQKLKREYDKLWSTFLSGKSDQKLSRDLDKFVKKQKKVDAALVIRAYIDLYRREGGAATQRFEQVLAINPTNQIALYYLAELAFAREDYQQASALYSSLLAVDPTRTDVETKRQKALLLRTESLLRSAANAENENRLAEAEQLYRQAIAGSPGEPVFHAQLARLLAEEEKWEEALAEYRLQAKLAGPGSEVEKHIAEALMNLGRTEEAREVLDHLRQQGSADENLEAKVAELEDLGRWGKDIEIFKEIKSTTALTREELAAMLVRYFPQIAEYRQTPEIVTDIRNAWARPEILTVVGIGLIDVLPNHTFEPTALLTRGQFAVTLARLSRILGLSDSSAPAIPVTDLASTNALYREVQLVLGYGLLNVDDSGNFNVNDQVPGAEAVGAVEQLLRLLHGK